MTTMLALFLAAQSTATAPATAEQLLHNHGRDLDGGLRLNCGRGGEGDEIVVCGRRRRERDPNRLPLPVAPEPGERVAGHVPTGGEAMAADGCLRLCQKGVTVPLLEIPGFIVDLVEKLKDDE